MKYFIYMYILPTAISLGLLLITLNIYNPLFDWKGNIFVIAITVVILVPMFIWSEIKALHQGNQYFDVKKQGDKITFSEARLIKSFIGYYPKNQNFLGYGYSSYYGDQIIYMSDVFSVKKLNKLIKRYRLKDPYSVYQKMTTKDKREFILFLSQERFNLEKITDEECLSLSKEHLIELIVEYLNELSISVYGSCRFDSNIYMEDINCIDFNYQTFVWVTDQRLNLLHEDLG